jgi:molybdopterin molybdotransferase
VIRYGEALPLIQAAGARRPLGEEQVPLAEMVGRVAAQEIQSPEDVPAFDNSAMDGFVVRSEDTGGASAEQPIVLPVRGRLAAGDDASGVSAGGAVEIMTGAPVPSGLDAVIRVEDTEVVRGPTGDAIEVKLWTFAPAGQHVRPRGDDFGKGHRLVAPGEVLRPEHVSALATVGVASVTVRKRPRVALVTTGKEVVPHTAGSLAPGAIRNSNAPWLAAALQLAGAECVHFDAVGDEPQDFRRAVGRALERGVDVLLTTGAVSMGRHDYVASELKALGAITHFHKVAIRPGKPIAFAELPRGPAVFALPGNPVSTAVGFRFFALPFLRAIAGVATEVPYRAVLRNEARKPDGLRCFFKAWVDLAPGGVSVEVLRGQGSAVVSAMIDANAWVILPEPGERCAAGTELDVVPLHLPDLGFGRQPRGTAR